MKLSELNEGQVLTFPSISGFESHENEFGHEETNCGFIEAPQPPTRCVCLAHAMADAKEYSNTH